MATRRRLWLRVALSLVLVLAAGWLLFVSRPEGRDSRTTAEAYLRAVLAGDEAVARALYRADALCSGGGEYEIIAGHVAEYAGKQVRQVEIVVRPAQGAAYPPGSESALITFEVADGAGNWQPDSLALALGPTRDDNDRYICFLR